MNFPCYLCNNAYSSPQIYWNHLKEEHELNEGGHFTCTKCNHNFSIRRTFRAHLFRDNCNNINPTYPVPVNENHNEEREIVAEIYE